MRKVSALLLGVLVFLLIGPGNGMADGSLQQMIDETPENGLLQLEGMVYEGNVTIDKPLTIEGTEGTVIRGGGNGNVITVTAPNVIMTGFTVEHTGYDRNAGEEYAAIKLKSNQNTIRNVTVRDAFHGIYLSQSHDNLVEKCFVTGKQDGEIAGQGNGIHLYYSNRNVLVDNQIDGTRDGMFFDYSNENKVMKNDIQHTRYGLHYMYSNDNSFHENRFRFNIGGAAIMQSKRNVLKKNEFSMNKGTRSFGLLLQASNENIVSNNKFYQNQRGLFIDQSTRNDIHENDIFQNEIGVELWASSSKQVFTENRFVGNTAAVLTLGGTAENEWNKDGVGNYWGNQKELFDLDQDGIGDDPVQYTSSLYQLVEENELAYLFLNSPAIGVYEKINEIVSKSKEMLVDEHPLVAQSETKALPLGLGALGISAIAGTLFLFRRWRS